MGKLAKSSSSGAVTPSTETLEAELESAWQVLKGALDEQSRMRKELNDLRRRVKKLERISPSTAATHAFVCGEEATAEDCTKQAEATKESAPGDSDLIKQTESLKF